MTEKVCKHCKRMIKGNICPVDKKAEFTRNWKGVVYIQDPESDVAKTMGFTTSGKYAIRVK